MLNLKRNFKTVSGGFTIIEVVLVLAIAGLIFLVVFLALPQLQASRRDSQRKGDAGKVIAALESYASNNNGTYPNSAATLATFNTQYVSGKIKNPEGAAYTLTWSSSTTPTDDQTTMNVYSNGGTDCDGAAITSARDVVVRADLEQGVYCQDNK